MVSGGASAVAKPCIGILAVLNDTDAAGNDPTGVDADADAVWTTDPNHPGWIAVGKPAGAPPRFLKVDEYPTGNITTKAGFCTRGRVYLNHDAGEGSYAQGFVFDGATGQIHSTYCVGYECLAVYVILLARFPPL